MKKLQKILSNVMGQLILFGVFYLTARCLQWGFGVSADRALLLTVLFAVAQGRWFQQDKSPIEPCVHAEILTDHEGTCRRCGFRTAPSGMLPP